MKIERSNYIDCDAMPDDCDIVPMMVVGYTTSDSERYGGMVKSIIGEASDGSRTLVGGLDDETRMELTCYEDRNLGRKFEATCNGRFKSGKLRHPRFKRWEGESDGSVYSERQRVDRR